MTLTTRTRQMVHGASALLNQPWLQYVWLLLIVLLASLLRFYKLGQWSFWIDEIFTLNHARAHFSSWELLRENLPPYRNWIPVSVILTAQVVKLWGISEWSARLVSAAIGVISIPILFFPTRRMFGIPVALIAAFFLAISPWHIYWSQNARFYTSLMLLYSLALFAFYFGIEKDRPGYLVLFLVLVYLAASERLVAVFIFPVVVVYLVVLWIFKFERPKGLNFKNLAILAVPLLLGMGMELYSRLTMGTSRFFDDFSWFAQNQIDDPVRLFVFISNNIGVPFMAMAIFSSIWLIHKKSRPGLLMAVGALVPLLVLEALNPFIFTKDRYMFPTVFCWILLMVTAVMEIASSLKGNQRWLVLGLFFVFFVHAANDLVLYYQINQGNRLPWKSAFQVIQEQGDQKDAVVAFWPEFGEYYLHRGITSYQEENIDTLLNRDQRTWFVLDSETIWTNGAVKAWLEDNAELVHFWYLRRPEENYLVIYLYDPAQAARK
jgi:mannosyltransferase